MISFREKPPRTTTEVFKMLPKGTRCELIEGIIYMSPAPTINHQDAVLTLSGIVDPQTSVVIWLKLIEKKFVELKKEKGKIVSPLFSHTFKF